MKRVLSCSWWVESFVRTGLVAVLVVGTVGCGWFVPQTTRSEGQATPEMAAESALDKRRQEVQASPGAYEPASAFAATVVALHKRDATLVEPLVWSEAAGYLDAVKQPTQRHAALADTGKLWVAAGDKPKALKAFRASLDERASLKVIPAMFDVLDGDLLEIAITCKRVRAALGLDQQVYQLMRQCGKAGDPLKWASAEDRQTFRRESDAMAQQQREDAARRREEQARRRAQEERRRAEAQRQRDRMASSRSRSSSSSSSSAGSGRYQARISVSSACKKTVRTFRGRVNGRYTGSGTHSRHSSNSTSSYSLSGDDELCIMDDSDREILSCVKPSNGARLEITKGCSGFRRR